MILLNHCLKKVFEPSAHMATHLPTIFIQIIPIIGGKGETGKLQNFIFFSMLFFLKSNYVIT